jgi:hypothetical protein
MIIIENDNNINYPDIEKFHKRLEQSKNNPHLTLDSFERQRLEDLGYSGNKLINDSKYLEEARRELLKKYKK